MGFKALLLSVCFLFIIPREMGFCQVGHRTELTLLKTLDLCKSGCVWKQNARCGRKNACKVGCEWEAISKRHRHLAVPALFIALA
jgi:hypothetical protein